MRENFFGGRSLCGCEKFHNYLPEGYVHLPFAGRNGIKIYFFGSTARPARSKHLYAHSSTLGSPNKVSATVQNNSHHVAAKRFSPQKFIANFPQAAPP
jgi:hypothetical protein